MKTHTQNCIQWHGLLNFVWKQIVEADLQIELLSFILEFMWHTIHTKQIWMNHVHIKLGSCQHISYVLFAFYSYEGNIGTSHLIYTLLGYTVAPNEKRPKRMYTCSTVRHIIELNHTKSLSYHWRFHIIKSICNKYQWFYCIHYKMLAARRHCHRHRRQHQRKKPIIKSSLWLCVHVCLCSCEAHASKILWNRWQKSLWE